MSKEQEIGDRVRTRRKELGLTQAQLALVVGMGVEAIKSIESGDAVKQWLRVAIFAKALKTSPNNLLGFGKIQSQSAAAKTKKTPGAVAGGRGEKVSLAQAK